MPYTPDPLDPTGLLADLASQERGREQLAEFTKSLNTGPGKSRGLLRDVATNTAESTEYLTALLEAMTASLALSEAARKDAAQMATDTRRLGRHSKIIGYSSLGLGVASLAVAAVALANGNG